MTITIEVADSREAAQVLQLLKSLNISSVLVQEVAPRRGPTITPIDYSIDPRALFGIWKDQPRTIEQVRKGWKRNWEL